MSKPVSALKKVFIAIASALVVVLAGVGIWFGLGSPNQNPAQQVSNSKVGYVINKIVPTTSNMQTLLAPASAKWWVTIDRFTPTFDLDKISWGSLPSKPSSLGLSTSYSKTVQSNLSFGLNAVYLTYATDKEAITAQKYLNSKKLGTFQVFVLDKTAIIIPLWAVSDRDFSLKNYKPSQNTAGTVSAGYWVVNFQNINNYITLKMSPANKKVYSQASEALGFAASKNASWAGFSNDGVNWTGNLNSSKVWSSKTLNAKTYYNVLINTRTFIPSNPNAPAKTDQFGVYVNNQSYMLNYLSISTKTYVAGSVFNGATGKSSTPSPEPNGITTKIILDPNAWPQLMEGNGQKTVLQFFKYSTIELDFSNSKNALNIKLTPVS
jgi:hypothetical protein